MSTIGKNLINKIETNKKEKKKRLLLSAYRLFSKKGINNTSIQDIVNDAGVAKGTFYLYFKDKYEIQEALIIKESSNLFNEALSKLDKDKIKDFDEQLIFVIDYIIDKCTKSPEIINFISKDLSLGVFNEQLSKIIFNEQIGIYQEFIGGMKKSKIKYKNPEVTLYTIIELVSSTAFNSITKNYPQDINEYKKYLYKVIKLILNEGD